MPITEPAPPIPSPPVGPLPAPFPEPWACDWGEDRRGLWMAFEIEGVRQALRWIPPGRFQMGSPPKEAERLDDEILHEVVLTGGYWLAETACAQALWEAVMGENPSRFKGAERPVESVSWEDAQRFIGRLNAKLPGLDARLPTEAEWEYACRAGTRTPFWFGEQITPEQANYDGERPDAEGKRGLNRGETLEVKALPANGWGLHQMHGNVWEWCADWYGPYLDGPVADPVGPEGGEVRVLRGGSWFDGGRILRSAQRDFGRPGNGDDGYGFRLARGP